MRQKRDNTVFLHHINTAIRKISSYVKVNNKMTFKENEWDQDAVLRNLEIIGEAANNLDSAFHNDHPDIPWRKIIDLRNLVAHDYADVDLDIVWNIVAEYLPELDVELQTILNNQSK